MPGKKKRVKAAAIEVVRKTELRFALDDAKVKAIKECIAKGTLSITVSNLDLGNVGRFGDPYIYD